MKHAFSKTRNLEIYGAKILYGTFDLKIDENKSDTNLQFLTIMIQCFSNILIGDKKWSKFRIFAS